MEDGTGWHALLRLLSTFLSTSPGPAAQERTQKRYGCHPGTQQHAAQPQSRCRCSAHLGGDGPGDDADHDQVRNALSRAQRAACIHTNIDAH